MRSGFFAAAASSGSGPGAPGAIRSLVSTPGSELAFLSWTAPVSNGGSAITDYQVQAAPGAAGSGGTRDTTFTTNTGTAFNDLAVVVAIQSDGKMLAGGAFTTFNGTTVNRIVRLNADGTRDTTFTTNTGTAFNDYVNAIAIQSDGKLVIGGDFTTFNGTTVNRIVRLNADGTRDTTFTTNTGTAFNAFSAYVNAIAIQSDGKLVIGGTFTAFNGLESNYIIRLNADGTRDTAFIANTNPGFGGGVVNAIAIQSDGKLVIGGQFTTYKGTTVNGVVRLNADGTRDTTFTTNTGTGFDSSVLSIAIQSDGAILCGGLFVAFNGTTVNRIVRLNADGTRDTTFTTNTGTAFNDRVRSIVVQSDGKVVVGGSFTTFNGTNVFSIVRLNANGTRDTAFTTNTGASFNAWVSSLAMQSDDKIVAVGSFQTFNSVTVNRIVRLNADKNWSTSTLSGSSAASYTYTGLSSSTAYLFRVRAVNAIGVAPWVETTESITPSVAAVVTGGTLTSDATYYYRTFTSSGTLSISAAPLNIDYALCSGGEGGNGYTAPFLTSNPTNTAVGGRGALVTQGSTSGASGSISIVVGAGGAGGVRYYVGDEIDPPPSTAAYGTSSSIGAVSSVTNNTTYADGTSVSVPTGLAQPTSRSVNGGGAGSSANGGNASVTPGGVGGSVFGGNGGPGTTVFGVTLGGGGGAASMTLTNNSGPYTYTGVAGTGGSGGGGTGGLHSGTSPTNGAANTGGGGGGGINATNAAGGTGGSGVVIVRYLRNAVGG